MPTLYILCGLPFAGKSTLGRLLSARIGAQVVEYDAINTERGLGLHGAPIAPSQFEATEREAWRRIVAALAGGHDVVYDAANYLRRQRDTLRALAVRCGAVAVLIWVAVPTDLARARWARNRLTGARADVRDEDFLHVLHAFEPPAPDEDALRCDGAQTAESWVEQRVR